MKGVLTDVVCVYVPGVPASKKETVMLPLVILIVILMVLRHPDYCSFGQITIAVLKVASTCLPTITAQ